MHTPLPPPPIILTFYDPDTGEVVAEHSRAFIQWKILKELTKLLKHIDLEHPENLSEESLNAIDVLIVAIFGNKFTTEDLGNYSSIEEVTTVLKAIMARARGAVPARNPTPAGD